MILAWASHSFILAYLAGVLYGHVAAREIDQAPH